MQKFGFLTGRLLFKTSQKKLHLELTWGQSDLQLMEKKLESKPAPARGLAGMFGAVAPKKAPEPPKKAGGKIKSRAKGTVATMSKPAERRATALALKSSNAKFTVTPSPAEKTEEKTGMDQDVTMGGTGNKKRRRHGL